MKPKREDYLRWDELWEQMMRQYCPGRDAVYDLTMNLFAFLNRGPRLSVLDVGCGSGSFTRRVLERFPHALVRGLDRSARNLHIARELTGLERVEWIQVDVAGSDWPPYLEPESFDAAFLGWITHEIPEWQLSGLYERLAVCLRPGGLLLNVDFISGLDPAFQQMGSDYVRSRLTDEWPEFNSRFEESAPIASLVSQDIDNRTRWIVHHSRETHVEKILGAGFHGAEEIWRFLTSALILGIR